MTTQPINVVDERIKEYIKLPVKYDDMWTYIFDADDKVIAQVRWRWAIQKLENAEEKQDGIWKLIAELLNQYLSNHSNVVEIKRNEIDKTDPIYKTICKAFNLDSKTSKIYYV